VRRGGLGRIGRKNGLGFMNERYMVVIDNVFWELYVSGLIDSMSPYDRSHFSSPTVIRFVSCYIWIYARNHEHSAIRKDQCSFLARVCPSKTARKLPILLDTSVQAARSVS
jgi:hypothetical protein